MQILRSGLDTGRITRPGTCFNRTRQFLQNYLKDHPERAESAEAQLAWEEIYIAEGSDWWLVVRR